MRRLIALILVAALTSLFWSTRTRPVEQPPRPIAKKLESLLNPQDEPDAALEYQMARRGIADGREMGLFERYSQARQRMQGMTRYSSRLGRTLEPGKRFPSAASGVRAAVLSDWEFLGPGNIGGRTRGLVIDPVNPAVMYAAGVSGGVWKTTNGGEDWQPLTDFLPNLAVGSLAMDPLNPRVIYAGTGEGHFREVIRGTGLPLRGAGIFVSRDGGLSWQRLAATAGPDFHWVNDLIISPNNSNRVYAATRTGVWRSLDGGGSWTHVLPVTVQGGCFDLVIRTDKTSDFILASCGTFEQSSIYRNTRADSTTEYEVVLTEYGMGRTSLALAPSNQDVIYALSASSVGGPGELFLGGLHAVFRSTQGGSSGSWEARVRNTNPVKLNTLLLTNPVIATLSACGLGTDQYSRLGWYTNVIAVDPTNPDVVWAGGIDLFRSDDGGSNWGLVSYWWVENSAHADQHVIVFDPAYDGAENQRMYLAGDGGIYVTDNPRAAKATGPLATCSPANTEVVWTPLNHDYGVTQFYHGAPHPDGTRFFGGTQDNGTLTGSESAGSNGWANILGGDGGYVAINPLDSQIIYAESQFLGFRKSTNGGATFRSAIEGISEPWNNFLFITPFAMDPSNPDRLWTGGKQVWRTQDGATSWQAASATLDSTARISAVGISPSDSRHVVVGRDDGWVHWQTDALVSSELSGWASVQPREGFVTWVAFDPAKPGTVYATYGGFGGKHIWKSSDGGASWSGIDGEGTHALPDLPVHALVVDPGDSLRLYAATDLGVLVSLDGGSRWMVENTGFANVVTESLSLLSTSEKTMLYAFTHGRGAWRVRVHDGSATLPCQIQRWITHVTPADASFPTTVLATNLASENAVVQLVPYDDSGTAYDPVVLEIPAGQTLSERSEELFGEIPVSHFGVCGADSVQVSAGYRITSIRGATAHVRETSAVAQEFLFYPGEWELVFDGMALVNVGLTDARITATLSDRLGNGVREVVLTDGLAPNGKITEVLDFAFLGFEGDVVRVFSSQPSVLLLLRGTRPPAEPMVLYETVPIPVALP